MAKEILALVNAENEIVELGIYNTVNGEYQIFRDANQFIDLTSCYSKEDFNAIIEELENFPTSDFKISTWGKKLIDSVLYRATFE